MSGEIMYLEWQCSDGICKSLSTAMISALELLLYIAVGY